MINLEILLPRKGNIHPYMETFADSCLRVGIKGRQDIIIPRKIRSAIGHLGLSVSMFSKKRRLLCLGSGRIESVSWPWCYWNEIVPVMWDVWPQYVPHLCRFIKRNKVRLLFCTSRQQAKLLSELNPGVRVVWLPEGVDISLYPKGAILRERKIDVLEYGRRNNSVHQELISNPDLKNIIHYYEKIPSRFSSLTETIRNSKISICYPQCDTNPSRAGNVETLTQRYWECMLSGTLICGRSPLELIDICGYDPCISLGERPSEAIKLIITRIADYQSLVEKNRECAEKLAGWDKRMSIVCDALKVLEGT